MQFAAKSVIILAGGRLFMVGIGAEMKIHSSSVGEALRRARLDAGIGQRVLADAIGISTSCLNRVEHGNRAFDTDWVARLPPELASDVRDALSREVDDIPRHRRIYRRDATRAEPRSDRAECPGA